MHDIFISYAREDSGTVKKLAQALVSLRGWSIWWDASVRTGERFPRRIEAALADSRVVLVVWSRHSVDSEWVGAEAAEGWDRGVLVPVRIDDCTPPMPFRQTQTADLTQWHGSERAAALLALVEDIQRVLNVGGVAGTEELLAREARQRAFRRRRTLRRWSGAAAAIGVAAASVFAYHTYSIRAETAAMADALAAEADAQRELVLTLTEEEQSTIWQYVLVQDRERLDRLELSILLAIEATRAAPTELAQSALREGLRVLPWSDWRHEIDIDDSVGALAFSHDGALLAVQGSSSHTAIWDFRKGDILARIAHGGGAAGDGGPAALAFSPTQALLATAGPDATARIWNALDGSEVERFEHDDVVSAVSFSPDGKLLATTSDDGAVRSWEASSGRELARMQHDGGAHEVVFSPSGKWLAVAGRDGTARVWSTADGAPVATLLHDEPARGVRFSSDERLLATFGPDAQITLWAFQDGEIVWRLPVYSDAAPVFATGGDVLVTGGTDGELIWWSLPQREPLFSNSDGIYIRALAASADSARVASISADEMARVWTSDSGRELKQMPYSGWLGAVAVSRDGTLLATAGWDTPDTAAIEVTAIWPDDPVAAACAHLTRNLTRNEWREYLPEQEYRATCPEIEENNLTDEADTE